MLEQLQPLVKTLYGEPRGLAYSKNGEFLLVSEDSGAVRLYKTKEQDKESTLDFDEMTDARCVAAHASFSVVSSDDKVYMLKLPGGEFSKLVTRHSLTVRQVAINRDGTYIATSSDDNLVRIVNVATITESKELQGFSAPVTGLSFDPLGNYIACASCDGSASVWYIGGNAEPSKAHSQDICNKCDPEYMVLSLAWSPNGKYLVSASNDKRLVVWELETSKPVAQRTLSHVPNLVSWHPDGNIVSFTTLDSTLETWQDVVPSTCAHPVTAAVAKPISSIFDDPAPTKSKTVANAFVDDMAMEDGTGDEDDDDDDKQEEKEQTDRGTAKGQDVITLDDDDDASDLDDFIVDDDAGDKSRLQKKKEFKQRMVRAGFNEVTPMQPPFQPGATSMKAGRRYLAFNTIGLVYLIEQDGSPTFYVEFHDRSFHRPIQFSDPHDFTLGSIGPKGAAFACLSDSAGSAASLLFKSFDSWAIKGDWTVLLPKDEQPVGLATGRHHVALITSQRLVRVFSVAGVQVDLWTLDGVFVAACAQDDLLMIASHAAAPLAGDQQLLVTVYSLHERKTVLRVTAPLSPKARLSWLGFSDSRMPLTHDSSGVLRGLSVYGAQTWTPLVDLTQLADTPQDATFSYWPFGMYDATLMTLLCKGADRAPHFPRPATTEVALRVPVLAVDPRTVEFEESYVLVEEDDEESAEQKQQAALVSMDKALLQLIQMSCKVERLQKALDLCQLLSSTKSMDLAIKVAGFNHLPGLAEKMSKVKEWVHKAREAQEAEAANNGDGDIASEEEETQEMDDDYQRSSRHREDAAAAFKPVTKIAQDHSSLYRSGQTARPFVSHELKQTQPRRADDMDTDDVVVLVGSPSQVDKRAASAPRSTPANPFALPLSSKNPFAAATRATTAQPALSASSTSVKRGNSFFEAIEAIEKEEDARNSRMQQKKDRLQQQQQTSGGDAKKRRVLASVDERGEPAAKKTVSATSMARLAQFGFHKTTATAKSDEEEVAIAASSEANGSASHNDEDDTQLLCDGVTNAVPDDATEVAQASPLMEDERGSAVN
ncbi:DNA polymerase alpha accessory factor Mcl1 [Sorochytrium milnesiophthora]